MKKSLMWPATGLEEHKYVKVDESTKVGMFKQALYKRVSLLHECFIGMDIASGWKYFPYRVL